MSSRAERVTSGGSLGDSEILNTDGGTNKGHITAWTATHRGTNKGDLTAWTATHRVTNKGDLTAWTATVSTDIRRRHRLHFSFAVNLTHWLLISPFSEKCPAVERGLWERQTCPLTIIGTSGPNDFKRTRQVIGLFVKLFGQTEGITVRHRDRCKEPKTQIHREKHIDIQADRQAGRHTKRRLYILFKSN